MRKAGILAALLLTAFVACDDDDDDGTGPDGTETFTVQMTGAAEFPGPGDDDGTGTAVITIDDDADEVCWDIEVADIELPATAAHIHVGAVGTAGDPVVTIDPAPDADGLAEGCVDAEDDLLDDILANPSGYYVNVHTTDFAAGAIRGQLSN